MSRINMSACRHRCHNQKLHVMLSILLFVASASICPITYALNHPNAHAVIDGRINSHSYSSESESTSTSSIQNIPGPDMNMNMNIIQSPSEDDILLSIRGGAEDEDDPFNGSAVSLVGKTIIGSFLAFKRAIVAGVDALTDQQDEPMSPVGRIFHIMTSMVKAAWDKDFEVNADKGSGNGKLSSSSHSSSKNLASYFCNSYGVSLPDQDEDEESVKIMGGSLSHALQKARSKARLLVVYIPGDKPKKQSKYDKIAIQSLLSPKVHDIAEKNARKKGEDGYGSFVFWGAHYNSNESTLALKRLKSKATSNKNPTLMVVYPSPSVNSSGSQIKIVPRVLAQHHCNPPPSGEVMSSWLNALRKRHGKQYTSMQLELKERSLYEERKEGYKSSMKDDQKREKQERMEEEKRQEEERALKEKEQMLKERRMTLLENLPDEPKSGKNVITIALRFNDGKRGQRRFDSDTASMGDVFNWVDAMFEMERERLVLSTMNGQRTFVYGDDEEEMNEMMLKDAGLGKMAALRVTEQAETTQEDESSDNDENDDGYDEEDED